MKIIYEKISSILCFLFGFIIMLNYVDNNYFKKKNIYCEICSRGLVFF